MNDLKIISRKEAAKLKLKRYCTGVECHASHICERYVKSGTCVECNKIYSRERYEKYFKEIK